MGRGFSQQRLEPRRFAGDRRRGSSGAHPLLRAQALVGNRAVADLIRDPGGPRVLARFDTGEHAQFGSDKIAFVRGDVQITEQEMVAMGDLYERVEDMYQADMGELRTLVALIRRDRDAYLKRNGAKGVSNKEWEEATRKGPHRKKSFMDFANENATHFGAREGGSDGRDQRAEWERIHRQALDIAHDATTTADAERAVAYNAFAAHFLTDAFAAGHMVSKLDVMERSRANFYYDDSWGLFIKETRFTRAVAARMLADGRSGPKLRALKIHIAVGWQEIDAENLSELLYGFASKEPDLFFESFIKILHDYLNETGVQVTNARGDGPWTTYGDQFLDHTPETLRIGDEAIAQSDQNLVVAHATRGPLDYKALFDRVWAYTPVPTASGAHRISWGIMHRTNPLNDKSIAAFAEFAIEHIDDIITGMRERHRLSTAQDRRDEEDEEEREQRQRWIDRGTVGNKV